MNMDSDSYQYFQFFSQMVNNIFCFSHKVFYFSETELTIQARLILMSTLASTISQTTNFRHFKLKELADKNFKVDENSKKYSKRVENTGKMRNCSFGAISLFPTVFSKDLYCRHVKTTTCLGNGQKVALLMLG